MFFRALAAEWMKVRRSSLWIPLLLAPFLTTMIGVVTGPSRLRVAPGQNAWEPYYMMVAGFYALLLLPLLTGVLASLMCRFEHLSGGWKQVLATPMKRSTFYGVKLCYVLCLLLLAQLLMFAGVLATGLTILHITSPIPWRMFLASIIGGWLAAIPLAALQLWVSSVWKSFGAPFALNVILTVPAVAVAHSVDYGPIYPWAQPVLAMLPHTQGFLRVTPETTTTIVVSGVVLLVAGWLHFARRDWNS